MLLCRVVGNVVSTCKQGDLTGQKLLVVQELHNEGTKKTLIACDCAGAGVGDVVVVLHEGGSSRMASHCEGGAVDACIAGVVDSVERSGP